MRYRRAARILVVTFVTLIIQFTLGLDISYAGVHPNVMLLLPIAAGISGGPETGAMVGFVVGCATDLLLPTPFGLSALVFAIVGFGVGSASGETIRDFWWLASAVVFGASMVSVIIYALLGAVLGQGQFLSVDLVVVIAMVALTNSIFTLPGMRAMDWALSIPAKTVSRARGLTSSEVS